MSFLCCCFGKSKTSGDDNDRLSNVVRNDAAGAMGPAKTPSSRPVTATQVRVLTGAAHDGAGSARLRSEGGPSAGPRPSRLGERSGSAHQTPPPGSAVVHPEYAPSESTALASTVPPSLAHTAALGETTASVAAVALRPSSEHRLHGEAWAGTPGSAAQKLRRHKGLVPLPNPELAMSHVDVWLRESTATSLLQALSTLRRLITFHKELVEDCLDDLVQLMQRLLSHEAPPVRAAAALGVGDLCVAFGDSMLSHMQHGDNLDASLLLAMIQLACTSTPVAAAAAKASLGIYATRLRQASVMRQLEHYLQYPVAPIRTKASLLLMTATYRLS